MILKATMDIGRLVLVFGLNIWRIPKVSLLDGRMLQASRSKGLERLEISDGS
jgi:hypothetical protein